MKRMKNLYDNSSIKIDVIYHIQLYEILIKYLKSFKIDDNCKGLICFSRFKGGTLYRDKMTSTITWMVRSHNKITHGLHVRSHVRIYFENSLQMKV